MILNLRSSISVQFVEVSFHIAMEFELLIENILEDSIYRDGIGRPFSFVLLSNHIIKKTEVKREGERN